MGDLMPNGDFEVDATGWPYETNCTIVRSTWQAYAGAAAVARDYRGSLF